MSRTRYRPRPPGSSLAENFPYFKMEFKWLESKDEAAAHVLALVDRAISR